MMTLLLRKILMIVILSLVFARVAAQDGTPQMPAKLDLISLENVGRLTELTHYGQGAFTGTPIWSPNGDFLAVPGSIGVWVFSGSNLEHPTLFSEPEEVHSVAWSADGNILAIAMSG